MSLIGSPQTGRRWQTILGPFAGKFVATMKGATNGGRWGKVVAFGAREGWDVRDYNRDNWCTTPFFSVDRSVCGVRRRSTEGRRQMK